MRGDPNAARQVLERLYPDVKVRRACEAALASAIRCAERAPARNLGVTLKDDEIRLNTGGTEALALTRNHVLMVFDAATLSHERVREKGIFHHIERDHYRNARAPHWSARIRPTDVAQAMREAGNALLRYVEANVEHGCPYRRTHSPGVLTYLQTTIDS